MSQSPKYQEAYYHSPVRGTAYALTLAKRESVAVEAAARFFSQWHAFSASIPALLSLCAYKAESEVERRNIVKNLYSELGLDGAPASHPEMLHDLIIRATGVPPDAEAMLPDTKMFIASLMNAAERESSAYVSGMLLGLEHVAYDILSVLKEVLEKIGRADLTAHDYITIHEHIEAQHIECTLENVSGYGDKEQVNAGNAYVMALWDSFWRSAFRLLS